MLSIQMELCGTTLRQWLLDDSLSNADDPVLHSTQYIILRDISEGLKFLHNNNVMHRDIKPENIMFSAPSTGYSFPMKLSDFGLCRRYHSPDSQTAPLTAGDVGTFDYMAPEVRHGGYGIQCDIFSFGLVAWEVLQRIPASCRRRLFDSIVNDNDAGAIHDQQAFEGMKGFIINMTKRKPEERMQNLNEFQLTYCVAKRGLDIGFTEFGKEFNFTGTHNSEHQVDLTEKRDVAIPCILPVSFGKSDFKYRNLRSPQRTVSTSTPPSEMPVNTAVGKGNFSSDMLQKIQMFEGTAKFKSSTNIPGVQAVCNSSFNFPAGLQVGTDVTGKKERAKSEPVCEVERPRKTFSRYLSLCPIFNRLDGEATERRPKNGTDLHKCIQECRHGDTIYLLPDTEYHGDYLLKSDNVSIKGANGSKIIGSREKSVIHVKGNGCTIANTAISGTHTCVYFQGNSNTLRNCDIVTNSAAPNVGAVYISGHGCIICGDECSGGCMTIAGSMCIDGDGCTLKKVNLSAPSSCGLTIRANEANLDEVVVDGNSGCSVAISMSGEQNRMECVKTLNSIEGLHCHDAKHCSFQSCKFGDKGVSSVGGVGNTFCKVDFVKGITVLHGAEMTSLEMCEGSVLTILCKTEPVQRGCNFSRTEFTL